MNNSREDDLSPKQKEFVEFLQKATNKEIAPKENHSENKIHLNSLITKNISLFTKNPNYKMLAWLITQLTIFSLFIASVSLLKNNLIPYLNNL